MKTVEKDRVAGEAFDAAASVRVIVVEVEPGCPIGASRRQRVIPVAPGQAVTPTRVARFHVSETPVGRAGLVVSDCTVPSRIQTAVWPVFAIVITCVAWVVAWMSPHVRLVRTPAESETVMPGVPVIVTVEGTTKLTRNIAYAPVVIVAATTVASSILTSFFMFDFHLQYTECTQAA